MAIANTLLSLGFYVYLDGFGEGHGQCSLLDVSWRCHETYSWFWWEVGVVTNTIDSHSSNRMNETRFSGPKGKQCGFSRAYGKVT